MADTGNTVPYHTIPYHTIHAGLRLKTISAATHFLLLFRELDFFMVIRGKIPKSCNTSKRKLVSPAVMNNELQTVHGALHMYRSYAANVRQGVS